MYREIKKCRICGNVDLVPVLDLGKQVLTGVFPKKRNEKITSGPLEVIKCNDMQNRESCGLLQLRHSYDPAELYTTGYGYRSSLNGSMVKHLENMVKSIMKTVTLDEGDMILDIGSNDGTLLQAYPQDKYVLVGIDPIGDKFRKYYPENAHVIPDFFSQDIIKANFPDKKAKIVTSIAMFYDLESPIDFMQQVYDILDEEGVWVFEQSYMPSMLDKNSYDTICHEHLEYYALKQVKYMTDRTGFKIIDLELNDVNGGSFAVTVAKSCSSFEGSNARVADMLHREEKKGLTSLAAYETFRERVFQHRKCLCDVVRNITSKGGKVLGYGGSTKGNVILQFCGFTKKDIPFIAEVNKEKFGCYTPGSLIPIISEEDAKAMAPDYFLVLPWHFKENFLERKKDFLKSGVKLLLPLPEIEII